MLAGTQELNKFEKAFKDPEFIKMFAEYAEEISDPKVSLSAIMARQLRPCRMQPPRRLCEAAPDDPATLRPLQNRAETDAYLRQMETESRVEEVYGKGVLLIVPEEGFVVKTTQKVTTAQEPNRHAQLIIAA